MSFSIDFDLYETKCLSFSALIRIVLYVCPTRAPWLLQVQGWWKEFQHGTEHFKIQILRVIWFYHWFGSEPFFLFLQLVDLSWWCCFGGNILAPFIFFYKRNSPWENIWISQIWDAVSHIELLCHLCKCKVEAILYRSGFILISFIPFHLLTALFLLISAYLIMFLWLSCCFQNCHRMLMKVDVSLVPLSLYWNKNIVCGVFFP